MIRATEIKLNIYSDVGKRDKVKDEQTDGKIPDSHQAVHLLASRTQPVILQCWIHSMTSYVQTLSGFKLLPFIFFPPPGETKVSIFTVNVSEELPKP